MSDIDVPDEADLATMDKSRIIDRTRDELAAAGKDINTMSDEELVKQVRGVAERTGVKISAKDSGPRFSIQRDPEQGISFKREKDFTLGQQVRGRRIVEPPKAFFDKIPESIVDAISRLNQQRITGASVVSEKERQDVTSEQLEDRTVPKKFTRIPKVKPKVPEPSIDKDAEKSMLSSLQEEMNKQKDEEPTTTENLTLKTLAEEMQKLQANKTTETKEVEEEIKEVKEETKPVENKQQSLKAPKKDETKAKKILASFRRNPKSINKNQLTFLSDSKFNYLLSEEDAEKLEKEIKDFYGFDDRIIDFFKNVNKRQEGTARYDKALREYAQKNNISLKNIPREIKIKLREENI